MLFNEKVMCGLGKGIDATGRMEEESVARALRALHRFRALSDQARATEMYVLATAAAREATNGAAFIERAEAILGQRVKILSGEEEAYYSAMGIVSSYHEPDGVVGDLGGGSLELVDVNGKRIGKGITLPLGGIRLFEHSSGSLSKARTWVRKFMKNAEVLKKGTGRTFYAVGGTWRAIAKLHMEMHNYPLHMMQGYEISYDEALAILAEVIEPKNIKPSAYATISKSRRSLLPYGAVTMQEAISIMQPERISFSALGVREGYLFSLLSEEERRQDPLLTAANELAILRARSPEHARELAEWTGRLVPSSASRRRKRRGAPSGRLFVGGYQLAGASRLSRLQALNIIAHSAFTGITHAGRAYIALANYYRFEGLNDDGATSPLAGITTPRLHELAKLLGGLLRVAYLFSASMPGVARHLTLRRSSKPDIDLEFVVPAAYADFEGERLDGRLQQLGKLTGKKLAFSFER